MISELMYIVWDPDQTIFSIGPVAVRWYSTFWLIGLVSAYCLGRHLFRKQKVADEKVDPLFIYCFVGILLGARLGHCLFYEPGYFLSSWKHVVEMILPIHFIGDSWRFTGYEGLASHGGTAGLMLALYLYSRRYKIGMLHLFDNICIVTPLTACCIRMGNLMNSEIIGVETDMPWGFIFKANHLTTPHHPSQLYEAMAYLVFFIVTWYLWRKRPERVGSGFFFGVCLMLIFTFRFFIEYTKEVQVAFENTLPIDMGQILSLPFIALGVYFTWWGWKRFSVK